MARQTSATPDYTMGFREEMLAALRRYTAEANAAYILPHLRPGHRVHLNLGQGVVPVAGDHRGGDDESKTG